MRLDATSSGKLFVITAPIPFLAMGLAWIWARVTLTHFQTLEGSIALEYLARGRFYHFVALTIPDIFMWLVFGVWAFILARVGLCRRAWSLIVGVGLLLVAFFILWVWCFVGFEFEAFN
ncbi:MAG: hypothetical protein HY343_05275 [Lentisphaerae bacterium]|nr:hypothetical protein [Lentisphaerota bacterium]